MRIRRGIARKEAILKHVTVDGVRLHLRTDEGKLWVNNVHVLFLNRSATELLSRFIDSCYVSDSGVEDRAVQQMVKRYKVSHANIRQDLNQLLGIINSIAAGKIPVNLVGVKYVNPGDRKAPNRMDISLSYACNNECPHCYLPKESRKAAANELSTEEWKYIITNLWEIGIPQLVFTGGECTLRKDLPELAGFARKFAVGIITNGTQLTKKLANELKVAEVDWVQITLESSDPYVHDEMVGRAGAFVQTVQGIQNCVESGLDVGINTTITKKNFEGICDLIRFGKSLGVMQFSCNALINSGDAKGLMDDDSIPEKTLAKIIRNAKQVAENGGVSFNWFLPTCYKNLNPMKLGFGIRSCSACSVNMMIEPNGDVIPCQSWTHENLGNIITDSWDSIWNSELAVKLRSHGFAPRECESCFEFEECGGGCPLSYCDEIKRRC